MLLQPLCELTQKTASLEWGPAGERALRRSLLEWYKQPCHLGPWAHRRSSVRGIGGRKGGSVECMVNPSRGWQPRPWGSGARPCHMQGRIFVCAWALGETACLAVRHHTATCPELPCQCKLGLVRSTESLCQVDPAAIYLKMERVYLG